jgi:Ring finger domain
MQEQEKQLAERASAEAARHLAHTLQQHSPPGGRGGFGSMLFGGDEYSGFGGGAGAGAGTGPARRRGGGMFGGEEEDFWTSRLPWGHHGGGGGAGAGRFTPFSGVSSRAAHHTPPHGGRRGGGRHYHHHDGGAAAAAAMPVPGGLPAQLAFVDRDFGPDDYETLLALDERIPSKGISTRELDRHTALTVVTPSSPLDLTGDDAAAAVAASSKESKECAVCLDVPSLGQCVRRLRCMHVFHADCIDTWLKTSRTCPVCKADVAPPREEKEKGKKKERRR